MRFGITSKMVIMAFTLVLCMSGITGWVFYGRADRILTARGLDYLSTDTCRIGHTLNSDIRQQRSDTWILTQKVVNSDSWPARRLLRALANDDQREREAAVRELEPLIRRLFKDHANYVQLCFVYRQADKDVEVFRAERTGNEIRVQPLPGDQTLERQEKSDFFGLPLGEWPRPVTAVVGHWTPDGESPGRPVMHIGALVPDKERPYPCGLIVLSMDLSAGLNLPVDRQDKALPAFLLDKDGQLLVSALGFAPVAQDTILVGPRRGEKDLKPLVSEPVKRVEDMGVLYQSARLPGVGPVRDQEFALHAVKIHYDTSNPTVGLVLAQAYPYEAMKGQIDAEFSWITKLVLCLSAGAAGLAVLFSLMLTRPLQRITAATRDFARGALADHLPVERSDEIGVLARSFQGMLWEIQKRDLELRESEARTRAIVETAAEGIITFDDQGLIRSYNLAARDIFGYAEEEVLGRSVQMLLQHPHSPSANGRRPAEPSAGTVMLGRVTLSKKDTTGRRKDATTFPMNISTSSMAVSGGLQVCIIRDITELKLAEEEISELNADLERRVEERTTQLQLLNVELVKARDVALASIRAKDTFLANMSHELRTPLNHIIGFCQLLEMAGLDEDSLADVNKIRTAGNNLLALINDILDFSKMEAGRLPIEGADFNAAELAQEITEFTQTLVSKKENKLVLECPKDLGVMYSDRNRVRQVLNNLLSNACKFTDHGTITLRARREGQEGDWLVFEVADTGIGMTPEQLGRMFQPFEQADSSISRRFGGTGLGLMLSRRLCRALGGDISVTSVAGQGSVFTARLPARLAEGNGALPQNVPAGTQQRAAELVGGPSTNLVLVIDDDPAVLELMERFLVKAGFTVRTASSGEEGLGLAKALRPEAITLDTVMPGIDGWAVLAALKTDVVTHDIPVIMATMIDDRSRGFALGAADYITKPIDWDRLSAILRQHCPASPGTVLVVDDDPQAREVLRRQLEGAGWQVVEAENGRQALEQLQHCRPAVILLDLMMPEMDGFELVHELRKQEGWLGIPIVVLTAKEVTPEEQGWLNGCVVKILQKGSINQDELLQEIQRQVTQRCRAAPARKEGT